MSSLAAVFCCAILILMYESSGAVAIRNTKLFKLKNIFPEEKVGYDFKEQYDAMNQCND